METFDSYSPEEFFEGSTSRTSMTLSLAYNQQIRGRAERRGNLLDARAALSKREDCSKGNWSSGKGATKHFQP
jgi:hypothetical protein